MVIERAYVPWSEEPQALVGFRTPQGARSWVGHSVRTRLFVTLAACAALPAGAARAQNAAWSVNPAPCFWECSSTTGPTAAPVAPAQAASVTTSAAGGDTILDALTTSRPAKRAAFRVSRSKPDVARGEPLSEPRAQAKARVKAHAQFEAQERRRSVARSEPVDLVRPQPVKPARIVRFEPVEATGPQPMKPAHVRFARPAPLLEPHARGLVTRRSVAHTRVPSFEPAAPGLVKQLEVAREEPKEASTPAPIAPAVEEIEIRLRPPEWDRRVAGAAPSVAASVGPYGALAK